jgi:GNAT superfamily N-acetyltransferase
VLPGQQTSQPWLPRKRLPGRIFGSGPTCVAAGKRSKDLHGLRPRLLFDSLAAELWASGGDRLSRDRRIVTLQITVEHNGTDIDAEVRRGIREADPSDVGARDYEPLALGLRDEAGTIRGGAYGATMWGWFMLDGLWVAPELRGHGYGARLLAAAEMVAKKRGCRGVSLGTFDFQARSFYERQGYSVFGQLPDFPAGHTHFQLAKRFGEPPEGTTHTSRVSSRDDG